MMLHFLEKYQIDLMLKTSRIEIAIIYGGFEYDPIS